MLWIALTGSSACKTCSCLTSAQNLAGVAQVA